MAEKIIVAGKEVYGWKKGTYTEPLSLEIPDSLTEKVEKCWEIYRSGPSLINSFIDRMLEYAINGFEWQIKAETEEDYNLHKKVFDEWASKINEGVPNILPGLDEITEWIMLNLIMENMAILQWEEGNIEIDNETYKVPIKATVYSLKDASVERENNNFDKEKIKIDGEEVSPKRAFALRHKWTPARGSDPTSLFLAPKLKEIMLINKLINMDFNSAQDIKNEIILIKVGDENHELAPDIYRCSNCDNDFDENSLNTNNTCPTCGKVTIMIREGTIRRYAELFKPTVTETSGESYNITRVVPYYLTLQIERSDPATLLNMDKYMFALQSLLLSFGIMIEYRGGRTNYENINVQNFKALVNSYRKNIKRFIESIWCRKIIKNNSKLKYEPNLDWNPLDIESVGLLEALYNLLEFGQLSIDTYWRKAGIDPESENLKLKQQLVNKETYDKNVPISYKQTVVKDKKEKETSISPTLQEGRPKE